MWIPGILRRSFVLLAFATAACERSPGTPDVPLKFASVSVAPGGGAACAVTTEGAGYCWGGENTLGNLGTGTTGTTRPPDRLNEPLPYQTTPLRVAGTVRFQSISPGEIHSCGTGVDGGLYCWGRRSAYGGGSDMKVVPSPALVPDIHLRDPRDAGLGVCGLSPTGEVLCSAEEVTVSRPAAPGFVALAPGYALSGFSRTRRLVRIGSVRDHGYSGWYIHQCGVWSGEVVCWGENWYGELGNGSQGAYGTPSAAPSYTTPTPVAGGTAFLSVETGINHSCALATDHAAWCWGRGAGGVLGTGDTVDSPVPARVAGGLKLRSVSVGPLHACGIAVDGGGYCWGIDFYGQLGGGGAAELGGAAPYSPVPARVAGDFKWKQISTGGSTSCGVTEQGDVYCWGSNVLGTLGNGTTVDSHVPSRVVFPVATDRM
jgi:alpha-tubulin suppressor-like RCC1 family protein